MAGTTEAHADEAASARRGNRLERAAHAAANSRWGDRGARIGLGARAVVYLMLAFLVARIATGLLGPAPSKPATGTGAAQAIGDATGGWLLLILLGAGMFLFAGFSLLDAVLHHNDESPWGKRWGNRLLSLWGVLLYCVFGAYCLNEAASGSQQQHSAAQSRRTDTHLTAVVLGWPAGQALLGLVAAILFVIAGFLAVRALRITFRPRFDVDRMSRRVWRIVVALGIGGELARAEMFAIVGWFMLDAAIQDAPRQDQGIDGAVRRLAGSGVGTVVLWALAIGLTMYALFTVAEARYRKV